MVEIKVSVLSHSNVALIRNSYKVWIDGVLFCTTDDDNEGFNLMVAKGVMEARKLLE